MNFISSDFGRVALLAQGTGDSWQIPLERSIFGSRRRSSV
jgi:hypothetical protein